MEEVAVMGRGVPDMLLPLVKVFEMGGIGVGSGDVAVRMLFSTECDDMLAECVGRIREHILQTLLADWEKRKKEIANMLLLPGNGRFYDNGSIEDKRLVLTLLFYALSVALLLSLFRTHLTELFSQ